MKWTKCSTKSPDDWEDVIIRRISDKKQIITEILSVHLDAETIHIPGNYYYPTEISFDDLEYLDETPDESTPAQTEGVQDWADVEETIKLSIGLDPYRTSKIVDYLKTKYAIKIIK